LPGNLFPPWDGEGVPCHRAAFFVSDPDDGELLAAARVETIY